MEIACAWYRTHCPLGAVSWSLSSCNAKCDLPCTHAGGNNVTLNLDASVLSQIFTCSITNYNNARIKALNPGIE